MSLSICADLPDPSLLAEAISTNMISCTDACVHLIHVWQWSGMIYLLYFHNNYNRGSYISAHVLLNLLNELGKSDKMRGLPSILSFFRKEFYKFNNTGARILDSIYHMTLKLF